jgi:hypothetical protein
MESSTIGISCSAVPVFGITRTMLRQGAIGTDIGVKAAAVHWKRYRLPSDHCLSDTSASFRGAWVVMARLLLRAGVHRR